VTEWHWFLVPSVISFSLLVPQEVGPTVPVLQTHVAMILRLPLSSVQLSRLPQ